MKIYHYEPTTGIYCGTSEADLDPLETEKTGEPCYLLPARAVTVIPPHCEEGQQIRFVGGVWWAEDIPAPPEEPPPPSPSPEQLAAEAELVAQREDQRVRGELVAIDIASIRSLREFVLAKFADDPDLPSFLVDYEVEAQSNRAKIK